MMIRVFAIPPHKVAKISEDGRALPPPNWLGYKLAEVLKDGMPVVEKDGRTVVEHLPRALGAVVIDHSHYHRAALRGECTLGVPSTTLLEALMKLPEHERATQLAEVRSTTDELTVDTIAKLTAALGETPAEHAHDAPSEPANDDAHDAPSEPANDDAHDAPEAEVK